MGGSDFRPGFDERREVWRLLGHLDAWTRVAFLQGECDRVSTETIKERVTDSDGAVNTVYWDLCTLAFSRGLSLDDIGNRLVRWVRRYGTRPETKDRPSVGVPVSSGHDGAGIVSILRR